jgi:hypothetical protein
MSDAALKVLFLAGYGPLVREAGASAAFYRDALALPLEAMPNDAMYLHTSALEGVKHFALWPLAAAAQSCFESSEWPATTPAPTSWMEFEVEDVASATAELERRGYQLLVKNRAEPWGQTVSRLLSPEGILVGVTFTPWLRG